MISKKLESTVKSMKCGLDFLLVTFYTAVESCLCMEILMLNLEHTSQQRLLPKQSKLHEKLILKMKEVCVLCSKKSCNPRQSKSQKPWRQSRHPRNLFTYGVVAS